MPIRFRCAYCNQLMGIARRKAGTVVRCPKCAGQVVVPDPEADEPEPEVDVPEPEEPSIEDFVDEPRVAPRLPPVKKPNPAPPPPPAPSPARARSPAATSDSDEFDVVPLKGIPEPDTGGGGVVMSPLMFILMIVAMLALVGFAYYMGYITGKG